METISSAHLDILEREMARAGRDFTAELKTRTVNHGYFTKLENLSFEVLGKGNKVIQVTYKWPCSFLPTLIHQPSL